MLLGYCVFAMPVTALPSAIVNLIPPYYAEVLALDLAVVGTIFMLLRFFDGVTDFAMGYLLDRKPFAQRHKPWLLLSLPLFLISIWLLFLPRANLAGTVYLVVAGTLAYSAYTIGLISHTAWAGSLARTPAELSRLFGLRELAVVVGIFGAFFVPALVEQLGDESLEAKVRSVGFFLIACFTVFTLWTALTVPDDEQRSETTEFSWPAIREFAGDRSFLRVIVANFALNFSFVTLSVLSYFLAAYGFELGGSYAQGLSLYFVAAFVGMAAWMPLARRLGDRRALVVAGVYSSLALGALPLVVTPGSRTVYFTYMGVLGFGFGAGPYLVRALTGNLANRYEHDTGKSVRGSAFAALTFLDKIGSGLAAGTVLPFVAWLGFEAGGDNSAETISRLILTNAWVPSVGFLVIALLMAARMPGADTAHHPH